MDTRNRLITTVVAILLIGVTETHARQNWVQDFSGTMQIDGVVTMNSSEAHLYVLSETEGLTVFRTYPDSLQWLYRSTGMQQRGDQLQADIRFAYIYGSSRRLTIVEPTSVLGVYSSTVLPARPLSVQRIRNYLYIVLENSGVGRLSLESPESVDSDPEILFSSVIGSDRVTDIQSHLNNSLYVLMNSGRLEIFRLSEANDRLQHEQTVELSQPLENLFLADNELFGTTSGGEIFRINSDFALELMANVEDAISQLELWNGMPVVRTVSGIVWTGSDWQSIQPWKMNSSAGNHIALVKEQLWISEFNQVYPVLRASSDPGEMTGSPEFLNLKDVGDIVLPYPRPLILPLELESENREESVNFTYRSDFQNAGIRGGSLYWQPTANQIGRHEVLVVATSASGQVDSTRFTVDVRPFNTPPRFTPLQQLTIPVGEEFIVEINAVDPDGMNQDLIRYIGVDMPQGTSLNETTGTINWTPTIRQVGEFEFQVIATDQYGAAAQQNISIRVVETDREAEAQID